MPPTVGPTENLFDALAQPLTDCVAGVAGRAPVDGGTTATLGVGSNVRRDTAAAVATVAGHARTAGDSAATPGLKKTSLRRASCFSAARCCFCHPRKPNLAAGPVQYFTQVILGYPLAEVQKCAPTYIRTVIPMGKADGLYVALPTAWNETNPLEQES